MYREHCFPFHSMRLGTKMHQYLTWNFPAFNSPNSASGVETHIPLVFGLRVAVVLQLCTEWFWRRLYAWQETVLRTIKDSYHRFLVLLFTLSTVAIYPLVSIHLFIGRNLLFCRTASVPGICEWKQWSLRGWDHVRSGTLVRSWVSPITRNWNL